MNVYFYNSEVLDCDCYVADYTESTENKTGVVISTTPMTDLPCFHLRKKHQNQHIPYLAVNLEKYSQFVKGIENCECIFYSLGEVKKPWVLFLETKYVHKVENVQQHASKAYSQMKATLDKTEKLGLIGRETTRIFFAYSTPGYEENDPFNSFKLTPNILLEIKDRGINLLVSNSVIIATPSYLQISLKNN